MGERCPAVSVRGACLMRRWLGTAPPSRALGAQLFGHAGLAQALADPFVLLPVRRARQREGDRRKAAERGYPRVGTSLQVGGERGARLVGPIQERVGRGQESV